MNTATGDGAVQRTGYKRLTINLAPEIHEELQALADDDGITLTELLKRAVALHKFYSQHRMVPLGAGLVPDHPECRLQGHQGLCWTEDTEALGSTGTRTRIVAAQCTECGQHQARVRVVYPPSRTITVTPPTQDVEGER